MMTTPNRCAVCILCLPPASRERLRFAINQEIMHGPTTQCSKGVTNDQWRIIFRWVDGDAFDVEIIDYH